jgi:Ca2+-binding RTX toxin-like protein
MAALDIAARPLNEDAPEGDVPAAPVKEPAVDNADAPLAAEAVDEVENEGEEAPDVETEEPAAEEGADTETVVEAGTDADAAEPAVCDNPVPVSKAGEDAPADDTLATEGRGEDTIAATDPNTPTEGDDTLEGTDGRDNIDGGAGDDDISGGKGRDTLSGGEGDDDIQGGDGRDVLSGGEGDDNIDGGNGRDTISGGDGQDQLTGGQGADTFVFEEGSSTEAAPDLITDFEQGLDKLDMNELLGANGLSVEQLDFTGGSEGQAGNITQGYDAQSGLTTFQIDLGGDSSFSLQLDGDVTLGQQDFSLAA